MQALTIATSDPRVKTATIHNSGLLPNAGTGQRVMPGMEPQSALDKLTVPTIYILGGSTDIACKNGVDDYALIAKAPVAVASADVGYTATFKSSVW